MVEEVIRLIATRGRVAARAALGTSTQEQVPFDSLWASEAPVELLAEMAPSEARMREEVDARILICGPGEHARGNAPRPRPARRAAQGVRGMERSGA